MKKAFVLSTAAALLAAPAAFADGSYGTSGNAIPIPDDGYDGTLASMASVSVNVSGEAALLDLTVDVGIEHTWAGDLVLRLESPNGTLVDLMNRPGFDNAGLDDGSGCCGQNLDFILGNTYNFDDAAGGTSEDLSPFDDGGGILNSFSVAPGVAGGDASAPASLSTFDGEDANGTWTLYAGDSAGFDTGILDGFTLNVTSVPAPGALALLGVAGLAARRRRRA